MGKLAGVSRQTISQIERGDYSPSVTLALKIAKICEVSVEDIFIYEEDVYKRQGWHQFGVLLHMAFQTDRTQWKALQMY